MTTARHTGLLLRAYLLASAVLGPLARRHIRKRIARRKEDRLRYAEKFGETTVARPDGPLIWLHAVGVGEVLTLPALIREMADLRPGLNFLVTSSTLTSARAVAANLPENTVHQYMPVDCLPFVRRFLDHWRPDLSVWAEQDIWPAMVVETDKRGIPLALVNGRMGSQSFEAKLRAKSLFADLYGRFSLIEMQDAQSKTHMTRLGVPASAVSVRRSLKAGARPLGFDAARLKALSSALKKRFLWLAASTHAQEERDVFDAHRIVLEQHGDALLILCPRDPARGAEAKAAAKAAGLMPQLQSLAPYIVPETNVFIADSIGEMGLWYSLCDLAFVGGSLEPVGGHNPYEAMRLNCAVVHGPHVKNFARDYSTAHEAGAVLEVKDAKGLAAAVLDKKTLKMRKKAKSLLAAGEENLRDCAATVLQLAGADGR